MLNNCLAQTLQDLKFGAFNINLDCQRRKLVFIAPANLDLNRVDACCESNGDLQFTAVGRGCFVRD